MDEAVPEAVGVEVELLVDEAVAEPEAVLVCEGDRLVVGVGVGDADADCVLAAVADAAADSVGVDASPPAAPLVAVTDAVPEAEGEAEREIVVVREVVEEGELVVVAAADIEAVAELVTDFVALDEMNETGPAAIDDTSAAERARL